MRLASCTGSTKGQPTDLLYISSSKSATGENPVVHACAVPLIKGYFPGVGDLFSALVLAHFNPDGESPLPIAVGKALSKTHAIVELTRAYAQTLEADRTSTDDELDGKYPMRLVRRMRGRELRLIQGQDIIRGDSGLNREMKAWEEFW